MKIKKILIIVLIGVMCFGLVGCESNKENNKNKNNNNNSNNLTKNYTGDDLKKLSDNVHSKVEKKPFVEASEIDVKDTDLLKSATGLKSNTNVEHVIMTEAMIGSQAYSFVLVKVTGEVDIEAMKKEMIDNIDLGKWICAFADKAYVNNYGNVIMLVMGDTEIVDVDAIYSEFEKASNNNLGKKLERTGQKG